VRGNFPAPQNFYDLEADFALGAYHQPYNNTTSFVIDLPYPRRVLQSVQPHELPRANRQ
jgi:hypothetical protein